MRLAAWYLSVVLAGPAMAQDVDPLAPLDPGSGEQPATQPPPVQPAVTRPAAPPPPPRVIPRDWRGIFTAILGGEWEAARLGIDGMPDGPLKPYARAELFTGKDSPRVELGPIVALLTEAPELPQAEQLYRLAIARGARNADMPG